MVSPNTLASAGQTVRDALTVFARSYPVVFAFGAIASLQRFVSVSYGDQLSTPLMIGGEVLTAGVRILFLIWVYRRLIRSDVRLRLLPFRAWGPTLARFSRSHPRVIVGHVLLLSLAVIVFKAGFDVGVPALFPDLNGDTYLSWVLAIKNVTIIPLTMIWLVAAVRDALVDGRLPAEDQRPSNQPTRH